MNNPNTPDAVDRQIDAALARLPMWQPPPDFAARLAAAAAREATPVKPDYSVWAEVLDLLNSLTPTVLACAGLSLLLGWVIPWSQLSPAAVTWLCVTAMTAAGAALTLRLLRSQ